MECRFESRHTCKNGKKHRIIEVTLKKRSKGKMELPIYQIDTFTNKVFAGNPAAVCLLNEWLPDDILQSIAQENFLPETSFVVTEQEQHHLRWFSPSEEMDLCGHGTLAAAYVMMRWIQPWADKITFTSRSGLLEVKHIEEDRYLLDLPINPALPCEMIEGLEKALGVMPRQLLKNSKWVVAVVESERQVRQLKPDFHVLDILNCPKIIVTAPGDSVDFVSRYFKTRGSIQEDPVTGSAHCTLMPYWSRRLNKLSLRAKQVSARGGELQCTLVQDRVVISAQAAAYMQGSIFLL
jgi:PhzF family phenazine biosynthesis protein